MKVLIISFSFPPSNVIGAIRVGKLARYLHHHGHALRVLTTDIEKDRSLPLEIPREWVEYSEYRGRKDWRNLLADRRRHRSSKPIPSSYELSHGRKGALRRALWEALSRQYRGLTNIPDLRRNWIRTAIPAGRRLIENWKPDIIFASAPPFTGLIVASRLGRTFDIPWVADFRDLWVDNPYYGESSWRRRIDARLERLTVRHAAALVTVSPVWAERLRRRHGKTADVIYNGYAEEDLPQPMLLETNRQLLTIRYTGSIYSGFRDPSPVFAAIRMLSDGLRNLVNVEFFSDARDEILALAARHNVSDHVAASPLVPYRTALELQISSDILLLLQWNDKRDEGNLPGKIFEYLYARRPILFIGYKQGVAARLIRERGAGLVSNDPERIRKQLQSWIEDKQTGRLKRLDPSVCRGLSRDEQLRKLEHLFIKVLKEQRTDDTQQPSSSRCTTGRDIV